MRSNAIQVSVSLTHNVELVEPDVGEVEDVEPGGDGLPPEDDEDLGEVLPHGDDEGHGHDQADALGGDHPEGVQVLLGQNLDEYLRGFGRSEINLNNLLLVCYYNNNLQ